MRIDLTGHAALVTGGARGIGAAIASELASLGARVAVADIEAAAGRETAAACNGMFVQMDVGDRAQVDAGVAAVVDAFGRLDIVVNNAGITRFCDFFDIDEDGWDLINDVDARGTFLVMRAAATVMRDRGTGGAIVNIASIAAKGYRHTSSAAYAAAKASVVGLSRSAGLQLAAHGIRVNAVCPGITLTDLNRQWLEEHPERIAEIPLGVPNEPRHIAEMVAFLASPAGARITAQSINVDGGLMID